MKSTGPGDEPITPTETGLPLTMPQSWYVSLLVNVGMCELTRNPRPSGRITNFATSLVVALARVTTLWPGVVSAASTAL